MKDETTLLAGPALGYSEALESFILLPGQGPISVQDATIEQFTAFIRLSTPGMDAVSQNSLLSELEIDVNLGKWNILLTLLESKKYRHIQLFPTIELGQAVYTLLLWLYGLRLYGVSCPSEREIEPVLWTSTRPYVETIYASC